ncbi:MAG: hypothetical protein JEZ14_10965 [Marinilabiliaceae bacterium]|nr:hypothetical protein [Marinilabiliaceae bacterium]
MSLWDDIVGVAKEVPVVGKVIDGVESATDATTIQQAVYNKLKRVITTNVTALSIITGGLAGVGLGFLAEFCTAVAVHDGTLKAKIEALSDEDVWKLFGVLSAFGPGA